MNISEYNFGNIEIYSPKCSALTVNDIILIENSDGTKGKLHVPWAGNYTTVKAKKEIIEAYINNEFRLYTDYFIRAKVCKGIDYSIKYNISKNNNIHKNICGFNIDFIVVE